MIPNPTHQTLYAGIPLIESTTALGVDGQFPAGGLAVDILDLLRTEQSEEFFGGGNRYVYEPVSADPRFFLYYSIFAQGAASVPAPGDLVIMVAPLDTSATGGAETTLIAANQTTESAYVVNYTGPQLAYTLITATTVSENRGPITGKIQLEGRSIMIFYQNHHIAQTTFRLTVSLRPI